MPIDQTGSLRNDVAGAQRFNAAIQRRVGLKLRALGDISKHVLCDDDLICSVFGLEML